MPNICNFLFVQWVIALSSLVISFPAWAILEGPKEGQKLIPPSNQISFESVNQARPPEGESGIPDEERTASDKERKFRRLDWSPRVAEAQQAKPPAGPKQTKPTKESTKPELDWMEKKEFKDFAKWAEQASGGQIPRDNLIHGVLFLEKEVIEKRIENEVKKQTKDPLKVKQKVKEQLDQLLTETYELLGAIFKDVSAQVDFSLGPKEVLDQIHGVLKAHGIVVGVENEVTLLADSLSTKRFDCDTASLLDLSVAQKLGLPLLGANGPNHFFVRYESGNVRFNYETTSGDLKTDLDYKNSLNIDQTSIDQGIFLKTLTDKELFGQVYRNRGLVKAQLGDFQGAVKDFDRAVSLNPRDSQAFNNRGTTKVLLGYIEEAKSDFEQTLQFDPKSGEARNNLKNVQERLAADTHYKSGVMKMNRGDYTGALEDFKKTIENNPNHADAYFDSWSLKDSLGKTDEALKDLKKLLKLRPDIFDHLSEEWKKRVKEDER